MAKPAFSIKDPADNLDYTFDFSAWLESGDSIVNATATASPTGLTIGTTTVAGSAVTVWLSGGATRESYVVSVTVTTAQGRIAERSAVLPVANR